MQTRRQRRKAVQRVRHRQTVTRHLQQLLIKSDTVILVAAAPDDAQGAAAAQSS